MHFFSLNPHAAGEGMLLVGASWPKVDVCRGEFRNRPYRAGPHPRPATQSRGWGETTGQKFI